MEKLLLASKQIKRHPPLCHLYGAHLRVPHRMNLSGWRPYCEEMSYFQGSKALNSSETSLKFSLCLSRFLDLYYSIQENFIYLSQKKKLFLISGL